MDIYVLLTTAALGGLTWGLLRLCDRMRSNRP